MTGHPFGFPFEPYAIQLGFMEAVQACIREGKIGLLSSPTGTGKSLSLLCGSLTALSTLTPDQAAVIDDSIRGPPPESPNDGALVDPALPQWRHWIADSTAQSKSAWNRRGRGIINAESDADFDIERRLKRLRQECDAGMSDAESWIGVVTPVTTPATQSTIPATQILFCSRTHSQLQQTIHELVKTDASRGLRAVNLGSRKQLCIHEPVRRIGQSQLQTERCLDSQKPASGRRAFLDSPCPYLNPGVPEQGAQLLAFQSVLEDRVLDIEECVQLGHTMHTCPYYGTRAAVDRAQFLTLPYSMLLSESTRNAMHIRLKDNIIIIDEAHNLIDQIVSLHCTVLTLTQIRIAFSALKLYMERYVQRLRGDRVALMKQVLLVLTRLESRLVLPASRDQLWSMADFIYSLKVQHVNLYRVQRFLEDDDLGHQLIGFARSLPEHRRPPLTSMHISPLQPVHDFIMLLTNLEKDGKILASMRTDADKSTAETESFYKFLLLNPARYFEDIVTNARTVILAGGTMEPVSDLIQLLFPKVRRDQFIHYQCGHVIGPDQLKAMVLTKDPAGRPFRFTYDARGGEELILALGQTLINLSRVLPDGMIVFLPSYAFLETALLRWRSPPPSSSILDRLQGRKPVFVEPRDASKVESVLEEYGQAIAENRGAVLFCVVGGKLSEGINFADRLGRGVVMVGLPYPNKTSIEMVEKMRFMDELAATCSEHAVDGAEYYENVCMRAVNQSIGRAIRHRLDYAVIYLVDGRYSNVKVQSKLPGWIRDHLSTPGSFGQLILQTRQFFQNQAKKTEDPSKMEDPFAIGLPAVPSLPPVQAAIRIRPLLPSERSKGRVVAWSNQFPAHSQYLHRQIRFSEEDRVVSLKYSSPHHPESWAGDETDMEERMATFDHVFGPLRTQKDLFERCIQPLVEQFLLHYSVTVFTYGQTGSGKTFTMGNQPLPLSDPLPDQAGILPRTLQVILDRLATMPGVYSLSATYFEIYCEKVIDLLQPAESEQPEISIRNGGDGLLCISGLVHRPVNTLHEAFKLLMAGNVRRSTEKTNVHDHSSRSHAVFSIYLERRSSESSGLTFERLCRMNLVDLAGSERLKRTQLGSHERRFRESVKINSGLLALANVIRSLAAKPTGFGDAHHVPYRASKLTRILQDSLGGNCFTLMIACISPFDGDFIESSSTILYASQARQIRNRPSLMLKDHMKCIESVDDEKDVDETPHDTGQLTMIDWEQDEHRLLSEKPGELSQVWFDRYCKILRHKILEQVNLRNSLRDSECELELLRQAKSHLEEHLKLIQDEQADQQTRASTTDRSLLGICLLALAKFADQVESEVLDYEELCSWVMDEAEHELASDKSLDTWRPQLQQLLANLQLLFDLLIRRDLRSRTDREQLATLQLDYDRLKGQLERLYQQAGLEPTTTPRPLSAREKRRLQRAFSEHVLVSKQGEDRAVQTNSDSTQLHTLHTIYDKMANSSASLLQELWKQLELHCALPDKKFADSIQEWLEDRAGRPGSAEFLSAPVENQVLETEALVQEDRIRQLEKDNYYFRATNRELKRKLKQLGSLYRRQCDELHDIHLERDRLEHVTSQQ